MRVTANIHAVVLAAGRATRFGKTKLLADYAGQPLVRRAAAAACGACPGNTWLVTGYAADAVVAATQGLLVQQVHNPDYAEGMGSSIARGVAACADGADAVIVVLADQPLVREPHLQALIDSWGSGLADIVATAFSGTRGPPVIFGRDYFAALCALQGDTGAKEILRRHADDVDSIACSDAAIDIDTPADLDALLNRERR